MRKNIIDFETASAADLKVVGAWRYSEDVTTEVLSLSFRFEGQNSDPDTWWPGQEIPENLLQAIEDPEVIFVAHNAGFEKAIWRNIMVKQFGWPDIPNDRWEDTSATCAMKAIPTKLERATLALRLPTHKDTEGSRITKALSKPDKKGAYKREPAVLERVYAYNRQDVLETQELLTRVGSLPIEERKVWLLDQTINERGVGLDIPLIGKMQEIVDKASKPLIKEFADITGGLKPTQTAKIKVWIASHGVQIDSLNKEIVAQLLGEENEDADGTEPELPIMACGDLPAPVRRVLYIRSVVGSASVKKLYRMRRCVCMDGRARGLLQYHGAGPGRWAGRLLQPHNFPRGTIKDSKGDKPRADTIVPLIMQGDPDLLATYIGEPVETVVSSLRHAIKAKKKHILLSGDFTGIEARVVLGLAGQHDKTELLANGLNPYCDLAQVVFKRIIDKKKDIKEYQAGKGGVLGLGFQMGWRKFKIKYCPDESDEFAQNVVEAYREKWAPKVPKVWKALEKAALDTMRTLMLHEAYGVEYRLEDGWLTARLPSGRKLWYFNPRLIKKAMPWDETDIRPALIYQQMKKGQFATIDAFGGLLTENVVQALARDLMVYAMFNLEKNGFPIILTVHDEIVAEPEIVNADEKAFRQIMQERPQWAVDLQIPVAVETWKDERYRK